MFSFWKFRTPSLLLSVAWHKSKVRYFHLKYFGLQLISDCSKYNCWFQCQTLTGNELCALPILAKFNSSPEFPHYVKSVRFRYIKLRKWEFCSCKLALNFRLFSFLPLHTDVVFPPVKSFYNQTFLHVARETSESSLKLWTNILL